MCEGCVYEMCEVCGVGYTSMRYTLGVNGV